MSDLVGQLALFTPRWTRPAPEVVAAIKAWNHGHTCDQCGHGCGTTQHHIACCGTERQHRHTIGSYCTGHPCSACNPRPSTHQAVP